MAKLVVKISKIRDFAAYHVDTTIKRCILADQLIPDHVFTLTFGYGFKLDATRIALFRECLDSIDESHVMAESLKLEADYDGERNSTLFVDSG